VAVVSSEISKAIVRVLDQLASAENRIAVSEAAVDMILARASESGRGIFAELAGIPLLVRKSEGETFRAIRALQERARRLRADFATTGAVSIPDAISEVEKMRDEWLEMKRNYKIDDSLWVAHKNYVNAAMQILDRLRSLSPEAGE
jgi:hypothetical protein